MRASSVFSRDHKVAGLQYGITSLLFLLIVLIGLLLHHALLSLYRHAHVRERGR